MTAPFAASTEEGDDHLQLARRGSIRGSPREDRYLSRSGRSPAPIARPHPREPRSLRSGLHSTRGDPSRAPGAGRPVADGPRGDHNELLAPAGDDAG